MRLARRFTLAVLTLAVSACGGMEGETPEAAEETENSVSASAMCTTYSTRATCMADCDDNLSRWYPVGDASSIDYWDCAPEAQAYCRARGFSGALASCWGKY
ncbi:hypothetical protein ACN469_02970 [Corallococcus terminator]